MPSSTGNSQRFFGLSGYNSRAAPILRAHGWNQPESGPGEVLPLLARNIFVQGYVGWRDQGRPTEFLILLGRYLNQAQELSQLLVTVAWSTW